MEEQLAGTVLLAPAVNLPALQTGTRVSPDHLYLNRRFPGTPKGFLTDQVAAAVANVIYDRSDCVVDLHSGTPTMALWYSYDAGDLELTASFGYLPVVVDFRPGGQLSATAVERGLSGSLPEFGGAGLPSSAVGVEGTLNTLRYRGHLRGTPTGPTRVPVIRERPLFLASTSGVLQSTFTTAAVGTEIPVGRLGWVSDPATGEIWEEFEIDRPGILLMAVTTPTIVNPGDFAFMVGIPHDEIAVPRASDR
jgi:predicted deacylase